MYDKAHSEFACDPLESAYKELKFKFEAYRGDCSTTAQRETIKGGIENHLQTVDGENYAPERRRLTRKLMC